VSLSLPDAGAQRVSVRRPGSGETTIERIYWSNVSVNLTSDVPGEAMLYPNFWGTVEVR